MSFTSICILELVIGVHTCYDERVEVLCVEVTPQEVPAGVNTHVYYFLLFAKDRRRRECTRVTHPRLYWSPGHHRRRGASFPLYKSL